MATHNPGKLREIREILAARDVECWDLSGFPAVELPEEGGAYEANAIAKARVVSARLVEWAVADDSGLELEGLGGAPGPYSARFGGEGLDDDGRVRHLLERLEAVPRASRRARFAGWAALAEPSGDVRSAFGVCPGTIPAAPRGDGVYRQISRRLPDGSQCWADSCIGVPLDQLRTRGRGKDARPPTTLNVAKTRQT